MSWTTSSGATSYIVTATPSGISTTVFNGSTTNVYVSGLSNGTSYTFTVVARNSNGSSAPSAASNSVVPATSFSPTTAADFVGRSMIFVTNVTSATIASGWQRIFDFNSGSTANHAFFTLRNGVTLRPRIGARFNSGAELAADSSTLASAPNTYVICIVFRSLTTIVFRMYRLTTSGVLEDFDTTRLLTINAGTLPALTNLWFGRSIFGTIDPYLNATFTQITLFDGDVSLSPSSILLPLVTGTIVNSFTSTTYSFAGTTNFYRLNVSSTAVGTGTYTNSSTSIFLNGTSVANGAFLTVTSFADNEPVENNAYLGNITNFNFVRSAIYTAGSFTLPSSPLPVNPDSKLLLYANSAATLLTDSSPIGKTVTNVGSQFGTISPFVRGFTKENLTDRNAGTVVIGPATANAPDAQTYLNIVPPSGNTISTVTIVNVASNNNIMLGGTGDARLQLGSSVMVATMTVGATDYTSTILLTTAATQTYRF